MHYCTQETCAKNYVQDLNRSIRQREELEKMEKLANAIEAYEVVSKSYITSSY